jgi:hypothetical protein
LVRLHVALFSRPHQLPQLVLLSDFGDRVRIANLEGWSCSWPTKRPLQLEAIRDAWSNFILLLPSPRFDHHFDVQLANQVFFCDHVIDCVNV